ncbi:hypothetical protein L0Y34_00625 [Candidatus Parcubacteria bacterium]|nr:hypothetical protein [Candidatus Parcubacteria bacterium]
MGSPEGGFFGFKTQDQLIHELGSLNAMTRHTLEENERLRAVRMKGGEEAERVEEALERNEEALIEQGRLRSQLAKKLKMTHEDALKIETLPVK